MNPDSLRSQLRSAVGAPLVQVLTDTLATVLLPDARMVHSYVQILVEDLGDGTFRLSDAGEIGRTVDGNQQDMAHWLGCAGADVTVSEDGHLVATVDEGDLAERVLSFGHYLMAAPVLWQAEPCIRRDREVEHEVPAVEQMADEYLDRIVRDLGQRVRRAVRRNVLVKAGGETARAPLAVAPARVKLPPRLIASFIDETASPQSRSAATRSALWLFHITQELTIPKYLLVQGDERQVEHLATLYDRENVATFPYQDGREVIAEIARVAPEFV